MKLIFKGAAVVEAVSPHVVHTNKIDIPVPNVIRLRVYRKMPRFHRSVSRKGIILRDRGACQYCGAELPSRDLTIDHVVPRSRGGESTWENLATACFSCNNRKADRTPTEAGMPIARRPQAVGIHAKHKLLQGDQDVWNRYLF
jgi:5-methylcytosine-specific restriction endonuclease McrA